MQTSLAQLKRGSPLAPISQTEKAIYRKYYYLLAGLVLISFGIAFVTPHDILHNFWASLLVNAVSVVVPNVANEASVGVLSQVAQFHSAIRWVLTPLTILFLWRLRCSLPSDVRERRKYLSEFGKGSLIFALLLAPAFVAIFALSPFDADLSRVERFQYGSRIGLGFMGAIPFVGIPFLMIGWYQILKDIRLWLFFRKPTE